MYLPHSIGCAVPSGSLLQLRTSTCNTIPVSSLDVEAYAAENNIGCKGQNTCNVTQDNVLPAP